MARYSHFGAAIADVLRRLPGAVASDFAQLVPTVGAGSTDSVLVLDSTLGLAAGDSINVTTLGCGPAGETRLIESVDSPTQITLDQALTATPVSGDTVNSGPATLLAALDDAEALIEAHLPARYRRLLTRVEGEVVVPAAVAGQTMAVLALHQASGLALYDNYAGDYADRTPADAMGSSTYSLDGDGRTITFSPPLAEGARIVADYPHSLAGGIGVLADLVAELAAARLARFVLAHQPEWVDAVVAQANLRLDALADGRTGIPELDAVRLVEDWERAVTGTRVGKLERS